MTTADLMTPVRIDRIVQAAAFSVTRGRDAWALYEEGKRKLRDANLSPDEYEQGINRLCAALGI